MTVMAFLDGVKPRVIAHRGLALSHPENTLAAFHSALEAGADILETDVHVSKDGQVVIAHDPDLQRVASLSGLIRDFTARELAQIDLGNGHSFPLLAEALEAFPQARFNIDLKERQVVEPFVDVIRAMNATDRVLVASFDEPNRQRAVTKLPGVVSSATPPHMLEGRLRSWLGLSTDTWAVPTDMVALQIPVTRYGFPLVTPSMLKAAHSKGLEVHVWTINDPDVMRRLWGMGVDGIVTDRTDLAVEARGGLDAAGGLVS